MSRESHTTLASEHRAVSPVIGVILMVAITVILAAVIGAAVLDIGEGLESDVQAAATIDFDTGADRIDVTFTSTQESDTNVRVTIKHVSSGKENVSTTLTQVGQSVSHDGDSGDEYKVTVVAVNGDRETVVQTTTDTL